MVGLADPPFFFPDITRRESVLLLLAVSTASLIFSARSMVSGEGMQSPFLRFLNFLFVCLLQKELYMAATFISFLRHILSFFSFFFVSMVERRIKNLHEELICVESYDRSSRVRLYERECVCVFACLMFACVMCAKRSWQLFLMRQQHFHFLARLTRQRDPRGPCR